MHWVAIAVSCPIKRPSNSVCSTAPKAPPCGVRVHRTTVPALRKSGASSSENTPNVDFWQDSVTGLLVKDHRACGVVTSLGIEFPLQSCCVDEWDLFERPHPYRRKTTERRPRREKAAYGITEQLVALGLEQAE